MGLHEWRKNNNFSLLIHFLLNLLLLSNIYIFFCVCVISLGGGGGGGDPRFPPSMKHCFPSCIPLQ